MLSLPQTIEAMRLVAAEWEGSLLQGLAQERALHLALEAVTDIGSYLIDGFIMRDAGSYEDIIDIIHGESVIDDGLHEQMRQLVRLRRPLVQDYYEWDRAALHPLTMELPAALERFGDRVNRYLLSELA
nr:HepT-like ribonuclease domain-containing protein [Saccharibacillus deserti]